MADQAEKTYYCTREAYYVVQQLTNWASRSTMENIQYHTTRNKLWGELAIILRLNTPFVLRIISKENFTSIKSALTCLNATLDDTKKLAFDTAVLDILDETSRWAIQDDEPPALHKSKKGMEE